MTEVNLASASPWVLANHQRMMLIVARLCLASLFAWSGLQKFWNFPGAVAFATSFGMPFAKPLMPFAALFELAAALMLITGWRARAAAAALALWMLILGPWFHPFWAVSPDRWQMVIDDFFHHIVMIGGMLYVVVFGPGTGRFA